MLAGVQHSALSVVVVVVAFFHSLEHSGPNLCLASLYLVHPHLLTCLHLPARAGCGLVTLVWSIDHLYVILHACHRGVALTTVPLPLAQWLYFGLNLLLCLFAFVWLCFVCS